MALALGCVLIVGFVVNMSRHAVPLDLSTVRGRVTDVQQARGGLVILLVPEGASFDSGHYYRYSTTSGSAGAVQLRLLDAKHDIVTLRYSRSDDAAAGTDGCCARSVFEISVGDWIVRSPTEVVESQRRNDLRLLISGVVLMVLAASALLRRRHEA